MAEEKKIRMRFVKRWARFAPGDEAEFDGAAARQLEYRGTAVRASGERIKTKPVLRGSTVTKG